MDEVTRWLERLGLSKYEQVFRDEEIDLEILGELSEEDLIALGLPLGPRRKILRALQDDKVRPTNVDEYRVLGLSESRASEGLDIEQLDDRARDRGLVKERKQVTVLFADIVRSTELINALDPEDARERLQPAIEAMRSAVHRYDGTVNRIQGDGIIALFGAPKAQEDHAERACRSALLMQRSLTGASADPLQIRVGLYSGDVLVDAIPNDLTVDYEAIGPTVHMASRLEALADPGEVVISAETRSFAGRAIDVEELGQKSLKGFSGAVSVFKLVHARDYSDLRTEAQSGKSIELIGRRAELETIAAVARRADTGSGQALLLLGDAGIGKSRLLSVATGQLAQQGWRIIESGATPYEQRTSYYAISRLINSILHSDSTKSIDDLESSIGKLAEDLGLDVGVLQPTIRYFLGLPSESIDWSRLDPPQQHRLAITALRGVLLRLAEDRPLALWFEDLHWFDPGSMTVLDSIIGGLGEARMLVVMSSRPGIRHSWANSSRLAQLPLAGLDPDAAMEMGILVLGLRSGRTRPGQSCYRANGRHPAIY